MEAMISRIKKAFLKDLESIHHNVASVEDHVTTMESASLHSRASQAVEIGYGVPGYAAGAAAEGAGNVTNMDNGSSFSHFPHHGYQGNETVNLSFTFDLITYELVPPINQVHYGFGFWGEERKYNLSEEFRTVSFFNEFITKDAQFYLSSQWLTKFVPSVYTLVVVVSLPLNLMAIIMFAVKMKKQTPAIVYMLNLSAADLLFVSVLPFNIAYRFSGNNWYIGEGMCRLVTAAFYCNMYCSVLLLTSISVDRFLAVVFTMEALTWRTKGRAWLICFFIWIISLASTVPLLITKQTQYIQDLNITSCHDVLEIKEQKNFYLYYFTAFSLLFFFLPLFITTICNISIIRRLNTKAIEGSSKKTRAVCMTVLMFFSFLICFGPTNIIFLLHYLQFSYGLNESMYFAYTICVCISSVSSCLDPLIYYYVSSKFRNYAYGFLCNKAGSPQSTMHQASRHKGLSTTQTFTSL
ncbi:proteinase-activated receptor 1-like [Gastrophryne carolinensis]